MKKYIIANENKQGYPLVNCFKTLKHGSYNHNVVINDEIHKSISKGISLIKYTNGSKL